MKLHSILLLGAALAAAVPATAPGATQSIAYTYDDLGRLTRAVYDDTLAVAYEYDASGNITRILAGDATVDAPPPPDVGLPTVFAVAPAAPNPFVGSTRIRYQLPSGAAVSLHVYDAAGRRVRTVIEEARPAGYHDATWDGRDDRRQAVASGVYFLRFAAGGRRQTREVVVLR
jgi:YD repeat-containing protein